VVFQLAGMVIRWNPFRGVIVPALPSLATGTNSPAGGAHGTNLTASAAGKGTNSTRLAAGTNAATSATGANTNSAMQKPPAETETNATVQADLIKTNATSETNVVAQMETKLSGTNSIPATNSVVRATNVLISTNAARTNAAPVPDKAGMNLNPSAPPGKRGADLPPAVQARISRIIDSEILGPVIHPLPMGLMGIAGDVAFLRTATGQTGLVKEGDSLGDIKLLRIGINRVLIEQDGQKKELMIFSGYGGDSLLPTQKDTSDENKHP
jgi:hypothetical protein